MKYNPKTNNKEVARIITAGIILVLMLFFFSNILNWFKAPPAQAAISLVNCGTAVKVGSGNLASIGVPAGIQNNDILITVLHSRDNVNSTMPGGWTQKVEGNGNTTNRLEVWWKRTTGTESAPTITHAAGDSSIAKICAFRGVVESGDPFDAVGSVQSNAGTPISTTAITTSTNGDIILHLFGSQDNNNWGSFTGIPATLAGIVETNTTGNDDSQVITYGTQSSAGSTGTAGASQTTTGGGGNDAGASVLMALKRNAPPTLSVSQPDGTSDTIAQDSSYNITYSLSDTDDVVTAAFYYDTNNSGLDGTAISGACATATEGTDSSCTWNTAGVTPGSYYVYGITSDGVTQVSAYSLGQITINAKPTLSVSQPDGTSDTIAQDSSYNITYSLSDTDDVVTAAFYYDTNNSGLDGNTISGACATAVEGTGVMCAWNTIGITPGSYYIYGITNDGVNPQVSAYSSGQITINARPSISISQPDGISDTVTQGDLYNITYSLSDTDDVVTAAFYYDTNNSGLDGTTISGACASAVEGTNVTCSWDTSGTSPGIYYVYGIANDGFNSVNAYSSGQITINAPPIPNITVSTTGTQTSSMTVPSSDQYVGGAFTFQRSSGSANITQIIISETGSVNAQTNLSNLKLYYETAVSCSFEGTETLFGTATSFNASQKATVTGTMSVNTSQICVYATLNVGSGAGDTQTLEIEISNPSTEVTATAGTVSPGTAVAIAGTTTLSAPNSSPTLTITQPDGTSDTIAQDTSYSIAYTLADLDNVVTVAFYRDTNNTGLDGTAISGACATAAEGTNVTCNWDTTGITPGSYYVYGITNDGINPQVSAYSSGQITINARPSISISQPDGASDTVTQGDLYNITYTLSDADDVVIAAFYYDTNNSGLDGTTISGACASAVEGTNVTCSWDTSGTSPGIYYVYGIANDGFNSVNAYSSGQITINAPPTPNISISTTGTQTASMTIPSTDQSVGGAFTFQRSSGSTNVTQIIISEIGSVNAQTNLSNLKLYYETAVSCSFEGTETLFGTAASFNASQKATATGSMSVGTSQICVYATLNVGSGALDTQTLEIEISNPSTEVTATAGTVSPGTAVAIAGTTTLNEIPVVTVTSITPNTGAIIGNTSVTVSGSNFQSGATVTFDGISATNITFVNSNTITAKTPAHAAGTIDVTVTNPDATAGALFNGFTYVGAPTMNLTASPATIFSGESFIINWSTTNADSCNATGAWLGAKATSGSENITPTSSATYVLDCTGVGGSGSDSVYVLVLPPQVIPGASGILFRFDGYSYSGGRVIIYDNSVPFSQLSSDLNGKFSTIFRLVNVMEKHLFSIIAYDKEGNPSPSKTFPSELYSRGGLTDILVAPTITLNKRALNKRENLEVSGYATPNNKVKIEIDDKPVGEITATKTGYYTLLISMSSLADGGHRARVLQANSAQASDYSLLKIFKVTELFVANSDLNNDGKLNISDWSIFLSSWSSREEALRKKVDLNNDGKINIFDLSIFLSSFKKR